MHQKSPRGFVKTQLLNPYREFQIQQVEWDLMICIFNNPLVMLTLLVQGSHVKNRCSRERRIRSHWDCELGSPGRTIFLLHLLPSCAPRARPQGKGQRPHPRYSKELGAGAEAGSTWGKGRSLGVKGLPFSRQTEGAKSATRPTFLSKHIAGPPV